MAAEGLIVTAGAVDTHVHYICPQLADEAIASGITTLYPPEAHSRQATRACVTGSCVSVRGPLVLLRTRARMCAPMHAQRRLLARPHTRAPKERARAQVRRRDGAGVGLVRDDMHARAGPDRHDAAGIRLHGPKWE